MTFDSLYKGTYYPGEWIQSTHGDRRKNLNDLPIPNADGPDESLPVHEQAEQLASVIPVFRDIEDFLCKKVLESNFVFGCVAWLTNERFLFECQSLDGCCFVVQKEDFLRPDSRSFVGIRKLYEALPSLPTKYNTPFGAYNYCGEDFVPQVRCVGNHNKDKAPAFPRMHHKFLVFCDRNAGWNFDCEYGPEWDGPGDEWEAGWYFTPKAVWTGSFNITHNASNSLENGIYIKSEEVAEIYMKELVAIYGLSEPLDWKAGWVSPEYRLGS